MGFGKDWQAENTIKTQLRALDSVFRHLAPNGAYGPAFTLESEGGSGD